MPTRRCPCDCAAWCTRCMYTQSLQSLAAYGRRLASQPQANPDSTQPSRVRPPSSRFIAARTSYLSSHRSSTHSARSSIHRLSSTVAPHPQARRVRVSTARAVQGRAGTVDPVDSPPNTPPSRRRPPPSTLASASASSTGGSVRRGGSACVPSERVVLVNVRRLAIYWRIPCARECGPNALVGLSPPPPGGGGVNPWLCHTGGRSACVSKACPHDRTCTIAPASPPRPAPPTPRWSGSPKLRWSRSRLPQLWLGPCQPVAAHPPPHRPAAHVVHTACISH